MIATRPEIELLLCCTRTCKDSERVAQIRAVLRKELDWAHLLRTAVAHGVMPLLYWHLNATCPEAAPKAALDRLRELFRKNAQSNLFLTKELLKLANLFEAHGIPIVPYKGPTLAASAYGNLALRQFGDLDLLVHRRDVLKAKELLISLGYSPWYPLTRAQEETLLASWSEHARYTFVREAGRGMVELHWSAARRSYFEFYPEHVWERLRHVSLGGDTVMTLAPEDLILILCEHGGRHSWERLGWICDVAKLIHGNNERIEWEQLTEQASSLGSERMLFLGLFLAHDLLGAVLPQEILHQIYADPTVKVLAGQVHEQLFSEAVNHPRGRGEGIRFRAFHLKMRKSLREKVQYCLNTALVPNEEDCALLKIPRPLWPLYYVARPIRLTIKYGKRMLQRPA